MKAYILKLVGAALISAFAEHIAPNGWQKYVKLVSGLIIISVLISPFAENKRFADFDVIDAGEEYAQIGEEMLRNQVTAELEQRIGGDIEQRVYDEYGISLKAEARLAVNDKGDIEKVEKIILYSDKNEDVEQRLKFVYEPEEVVWNE